jgi:hypothetical protein
VADQVRTIFRRHASVIAVLVTAAVSFVTLALVVHESSEREKAIADQRAERLEQICVSISDNRLALIDLTGVVLEGDNTSLPLTAIPEFQQLDPRTQAYVAALEQSQATDDPGIRERIDDFRAGLLAAPLPEFCG